MDYIKISGSKYPVKFGLSVIRRFAAQKGFTTLDEFEKWYTTANEKSLGMLDDIAVLILLGIKRGCQIDKIECDITTDDLLDLIQEDPEEFLKLQSILQISVVGEVDTTVQHPKTQRKKKQ